jgi:LuxR family transcriptional regulator, quorum-sensing system regulator CinR
MTIVPADKILLEAFSIIENTQDMEAVIISVRDLLNVDHAVYNCSKLAATPSLASHYIRLTYPAAWIKRYLLMGYIDVDPVIREGYARALPFDWNELKVNNAAEESFWTDAYAHGIGPQGLSIPVRSKRGHPGLFSISSKRSTKDWVDFRRPMQSTLIQIANRIHQRVISELFGETLPNLTNRELECLCLVAVGKDAKQIAADLKISPFTAREYLKSARYKLESVTSAQAVNKAIKLGLLIL